MSKVRGSFCIAVAIATLAACGSNSTTSTVATGTARGTLIENPPFRIASLDAATFEAQLNASPAGQSLLALAGAPACGVDFYYVKYWTVGAAAESATASGATNPVCMSTTSSAVFRASIVVNGCTRPRRCIEISTACCAISILCIGRQAPLSPSWRTRACAPPRISQGPWARNAG